MDRKNLREILQGKVREMAKVRGVEIGRIGYWMEVLELPRATTAVS